MQRLEDDFLEKVEAIVPLKDKAVLDIGCGDGERSANIATHCKTLLGIDPDRQSIMAAKARRIPNAHFELGSAQALPCRNQFFDIVLFTLSLHHVPPDRMHEAIDEALRVVRPAGYIIFLEPATEGSFFQAEKLFNISDGDETPQKAAAYKAMQNHAGLQLVQELNDQTSLQFDSPQDIIDNLQPTKNLNQLSDFLRKNQNILWAKRRINIYQPLLN